MVSFEFQCRTRLHCAIADDRRLETTGNKIYCKNVRTRDCFK